MADSELISARVRFTTTQCDRCEGWEQHVYVTDFTTDDGVVTSEVRGLTNANHQRGCVLGDTVPREQMTVDQFREAVGAERASHVTRGYDTAHDRAHGVPHLLRWAIDYASRGEAVKSGALIVAALSLSESLAREERGVRAERDACRSDAEAWRRHMAQQASVDNATPPRHATGGPVVTPRRYLDADNTGYVLTAADLDRLGLGVSQPHNASPLAPDPPAVIYLRPSGPPQPIPNSYALTQNLNHDKTTALAEDREADPTDDCD